MGKINHGHAGAGGVRDRRLSLGRGVAVLRCPSKNNTSSFFKMQFRQVDYLHEDLSIFQNIQQWKGEQDVVRG